MANYGLRVSKPTKDVLTCADSDTLFTTKKSIPKSESWYEKNLETGDNPVSVSHSVGAIPFVVAYGTADNSKKVMAPFLNYNDVTNVNIFASASTTVARFNVIQGSPVNKQVFAYIIFPEI